MLMVMTLMVMMMAIMMMMMLIFGHGDVFADDINDDAVDINGNDNVQCTQCSSIFTDHHQN